MIWLPVLMAVFGAAGVIGKKVFLNRSRIAEKQFLSTYTLILAVYAVLAGLGFGSFDGFDSALLLQPRIVGLMALYLLVTTVGIWYYYQGIRRETLSKDELMSLLDLMLSFLFASLLFPEERSLTLWIAAAIAFGAFALAHLRRHHFQFDKAEWPLLGAAVLFALQANIVKFILADLTPDQFYVIRTVLLAVIFSVIFGIHIHRQRRVLLGWMASLAFLSMAYILTSYYSFDLVGVSETSLIELLTPIIVFAWAQVVVHEKSSARVAVSGLVIVAVIAYLALFGI